MTAGNEPPTPETTTVKAPAELGSAISEAVDLIRSVADGDLSKRIQPRFPDGHPVGALALRLNLMIDSLALARKHVEAHQLELRSRIGTIESQQLAIRELATPIIEVWDRILCLPVVGILDSSRAAEMTSALLGTVVAKRALFVILDVTGIQVMDTRTTDHFIRMARSIRFLGSTCVLSGVNPSVALTVIRMGVDLQGLRSHRNMRDALKFCARAVMREQEANATSASWGEPTPT